MEALSQKVTTSTTTTTISEWETPVQIEDNSSVNTEGSYTSTTRTVLPTSEVALGAAAGKNTGDAHLSTILDLRENNVETGFIAIKFTIQILEAQLKPGTHTSEGFTILQWGTSGVNGTLTLSYIPVSATRSRPHSFVLRVTGDSDRICTVMPAHAGVLMNMYLEYNGTDLILACDDSADSYSSTVELAPPTSPNALYFGADVEGMFFGDLSVYNQGLGTTTTSAVTQFPYFLWDSDSSGVIAVIPTPNAPTLSITTPQQLTATSEPFVPYGKSGQLTIDGNPVVSNAAVSSLTRTDWQGRVALSPAAARTNLLTYSQDFSNSAWLKLNASVGSSATAPDGTNTAILLVEDSNKVAHYLRRSGATAGVQQTFSVYVKAGGRTQIAMQLGNLSAYFDLSTGTVITGTGASIVNAGNGWCRCKITGTPSNNDTLIYIASSGSVTYQGDGVSGVYLWGSQLENGSVVTPYIPTTSAPVTVTDSAARTNLWNQSNDFTVGFGTIASGTGIIPILTPNYTLAPDGVNYATRLILDKGAGTTTGDRSCLTRSVPIDGLTRAFSIWMKSNTTSSYNVQIRCNGASTSVLVTPTWKRFTVTGSSSADSTGWIALRGGYGTSDYADLSIAFAQLEFGNLATPFIFTVDAPVTVTDYAYTSAGVVTLGETPSEGAMFTWSGSGLVTAGYFTFIDRGYTAGHIPASFDLSTTDTLSVVKLYINEQSFALSGFTGTTAASLVTWLTAQNSGEFSFLFDGKTEILKFTKVSDTSVSVCHKRGSTLGQLSFAIKFTGASGSDWGKTVAILGKIPQQYCLPHTGKVNEGISILGTNCQVTAPKALKVQRRDDNVRTIGRIIGNVKNRPGGVASYYVCEPTSFFGSSQAPFPKNSLVFGNPNKLASTLDSNSAFTYGLVWERFIQIEPSDITMHKYPVHRSRVGDIIAAFSLDIPMGTILRGLDINFAAMAVGLVGNCASTTKGFGYDWGEGYRKFVFQLNGNSDYSCIFYLFVATNSDATLWRPVPSMGVDAVKVSGANTWKDVSFKAVDYASLVDEDGNSLLQGQRRTHFKIVLANELSSVVYNGLSYTKKKSGKK